MSNRTHRADIFTQQAGNITGPAHSDGVKGADKPCFLGADCHTGAAIDAGIPANIKNDRFFFAHIFLYSE